MSRSSLELQPVSWSAHHIPHAICSRFGLRGGRGILPEGGNGVVHQAPGLPPLRPGLPFDGGTAEIVVGVERGARPLAPARPSGLCRTGKAGNPGHEYHPMAQRPRWQRTAKPILSCGVGKVSPGRPAGCGWSHRFCRWVLAPEQQPPTRRPPANMQGLRGHLLWPDRERSGHSDGTSPSRSGASGAVDLSGPARLSSFQSRRRWTPATPAREAPR